MTGTTGTAPPGALQRLACYYFLALPLHTIIWVIAQVYRIAASPLKNDENYNRPGRPNFKDNMLVKFGQFSWDMARATAWPRACNMAKVVKLGSPLPDVPVYTLGGESCRLVDILSTDKPTVINFGSLT